MKQLLNRQNIPVSLGILAALVAGLLFMLPTEQTLGHVLKAVFLHGAIARTGLIVFGVAGLVGATALVWNRPAVNAWSLAAQKTAVVMWIAYALTGLVSSYLAWGVAAPWDEPQVQAGFKVLVTCIIFLILTLWINDSRFTAAANIVMGVLAWVLMTTAPNLRHPTNPIGTSESMAFKWMFEAVFVVVALMAIQVARWLHREAVE